MNILNVLPLTPRLLTNGGNRQIGIKKDKLLNLKL